MTLREDIYESAGKRHSDTGKMEGVRHSISQPVDSPAIFVQNLGGTWGGPEEERLGTEYREERFVEAALTGLEGLLSELEAEGGLSAEDLTALQQSVPASTKAEREKMHTEREIRLATLRIVIREVQKVLTALQKLENDQLDALIRAGDSGSDPTAELERIQTEFETKVGESLDKIMAHFCNAEVFENLTRGLVAAQKFTLDELKNVFRHMRLPFKADTPEAKRSDEINELLSQSATSPDAPKILQDLGSTLAKFLPVFKGMITQREKTRDAARQRATESAESSRRLAREDRDRKNQLPERHAAQTLTTSGLTGRTFKEGEEKSIVAALVAANDAETFLGVLEKEKLVDSESVTIVTITHSGSVILVGNDRAANLEKLTKELSVRQKAADLPPITHVEVRSNKELQAIPRNVKAQRYGVMKVSDRSIHPLDANESGQFTPESLAAAGLADMGTDWHKSIAKIWPIGIEKAEVIPIASAKETTSPLPTATAVVKEKVETVLTGPASVEYLQQNLERDLASFLAKTRLKIAPESVKDFRPIQRTEIEINGSQMSLATYINTAYSALFPEKKDDATPIQERYELIRHQVKSTSKK